jgi:ABC-type Fe3+-siderophore transport system permease subunit
MKIIHDLSEGAMTVCILLILFFGTGLDSEGYTCLNICVITLVPLIISLIVWYLTQNERRM